MSAAPLGTEKRRVNCCANLADKGHNDWGDNASISGEATAEPGLDGYDKHRRTGDRGAEVGNEWPGGFPRV